ncbi:hypothetical protein [Frigidibacter sp. SD6-1]|uniref:hypothetical protein n=1 Tax=Frigidibacter sp. SD6-1 TaxID=3032581 RepID=UPI0024DFE61F|nr:hypothetical protein [Frigidibacter sp. SD6-1]
MLNDIEHLRDRTSALLSQVLADWSQYLIECEDVSLPPIDRLASELTAARDALGRAWRAAAEVEARREGFEERLTETVREGVTERRVTVDFEERPLDRPLRPGVKKSERK